MPNTLLSPNMNLAIPVVGQDPGPQYATDVNSCFTLVDQHDHSAGKGVQITPAGMNINANLSFANNFATNVAGINLQAQGSTPGVNTIYESGVDLFYVDGVGNNIRITQSGAVAGTPGSISNLTSPASASYVAANRTFVWQSGANIAANLDAASLLMRNIFPNSTFALTLQPPSGMGANYSLTLPTLPSQQSFMTLDASGVMSAPWTVDGTTITIMSNQLVATQLPAASESEVNAGTVTNKYVSPATLAGKTRSAVFNIAGTYTWTAPVGVHEIVLSGRGGAGGGGSGFANTAAANACGGGGGQGVVSYTITAPVTPGTVYTIVVGAGGAGGAGTAGTGSNPGGNGSASQFTDGVNITSNFNNVGNGGAGGVNGGTASGGSGGAFNTYGGSGGASVHGNGQGGFNGSGSLTSTGGSGGGTASSGGAAGGGGGGAGDGVGANGASASSPTAPGGNGTNGGGGGGSCGVDGSNSGNGGNGSDGQIVIIYSDVSILNTST